MLDWAEAEPAARQATKPMASADFFMVNLPGRLSLAVTLRLYGGQEKGRALLDAPDH
jgi:hypothetical protein